LGVHIDGYIATLAHTSILNPNPVPVTGRQADVVAAAYFASEAALRLVKYGGRSTDVVEAINSVANIFGVKPVSGTSSYLIKRYILESQQVGYTRFGVWRAFNVAIKKAVFFLLLYTRPISNNYSSVFFK
jgi:methionine aminopeptidase